jgi:hypothetical protein
MFHNTFCDSDTQATLNTIIFTHIHPRQDNIPGEMALKDAQDLTFSNMISQNLMLMSFALTILPIPVTVRIMTLAPPVLITPATAVIVPMVWVTVMVFRRALAPVPIPVMAVRVIIPTDPFNILATTIAFLVVWVAAFSIALCTLYVIAL